MTPITYGVTMRKASVWFALHTVFAAVVMAASGAAFIYLSFHSWQSGEFHTRFFDRVLRPTSNPIEFYLVTVAGALFGMALLLYAPLMLSKVFAPPEERARMEADNPKIYGPVRPALLVAIVVLSAMMLTAWALGR
jgi:hypothetical protein